MPASLRALLIGGSQLLTQPKILLTLVIVILFPLALTYVMYSFVSTSTENAASAHRQRIGTLHDVFHATLATETYSGSSTQALITSLVKSNSDITDIEVGFETTAGIVVVAALDEKKIGGSVPKSDRYTRALIQPGTPIALEYFNNGIRYWETTSTHTDALGTVWYVVTRQSFQDFDALIDAREWYAYGMLAASFGFLLLMAVWQIRNIDYEQRYQLSESNRNEQTQISNMIAHELRSPLTAMRGYASMIIESTDSASAAHTYAQRIDESTSRLVQIVNDFLEVARLQSGQLQIAPVESDVVAIIGKVTDELRPLADAKGLQLICETGTSAITAIVDPARVHQVLTNIVSNAIKYTKEGKVVVELSSTARELEFRIKDTGAGISAENQKKLFTPFFRVQNDDTNVIVGTGLGMWITKRLVESQQGTIGIESIKNVGTNVVVSLPRMPRA